MKESPLSHPKKFDKQNTSPLDWCENPTAISMRHPKTGSDMSSGWHAVIRVCALMY